ncbi:MAG: PKD domain-containing protein [Bacteroidota bacterium]
MIRNILLLFILIGLTSAFMGQRSGGETLQADFGSDLRGGCAPLSIKFFDSSIGDISSWEWEFPGGQPATSNEQNPVVQYDSVGVFDVKLRINSVDSSSVVLKEAYVTIKNRRPVVDFSFETTNTTVTFTNNSQFVNEFVWEFGDGTFSNEVSPTHTYDKDGVYIIRLKATNNCGAVVQSDILILGGPTGPVGYTANDVVHPYTRGFRPGSNLGYFPPWQDEQLADIAAGNPDYDVPGAGCKSVRPAQHESFLEEWGYDIRVETFNHYASLGLEDNTVIVGFPSDAHKDTTHHCPEYRSEMFANLYTDIWDNGENGTPVNDENYLALYLYKIVHLQKDKTKFWEIWNEPGFDYTFVTGYLPQGQDGNWWDNNPDPCDYKLRAPIFHYIRTLRISYEIIKAIDPDAYVTLASVGFTSFLDAILRNTDNPTDGSVNGDYPLQGGAYFDAIAIHSYPHFDGSMQEWDQENQIFHYYRHSDRAASSIQLNRDTFQSVLSQYGYDGNTYPEKEWIITEINIPRRAFGNFIGSDEAQVNFIIKAYIAAVQNKIQQMHIFDMAESFEIEDAVNEFQVMGLYKRLFESFPYDQRINDLGIAYKTTSDLLFGSTYDEGRSNALMLPDNIGGAAFLDRNGHYTYVLWAKTSIDNSEEAAATYTFPAPMNIDEVERRAWDFSTTGQESLITGQAVALTGSPIFLTDLNTTLLVPPAAGFAIDTAIGCLPLSVRFTDQSSTNVEQWQWTFEGGQPATSTEAAPTVSYELPGEYDVRLVVSNGAGSDSMVMQQLIVVDEQAPQAGFSAAIFDEIVTYTSTSQASNAIAYSWAFGDGTSSTSANPTHKYPVAGVYTVTQIVSNGCGSDTSQQIIIIGPDQTPPIPEFTADITSGCAPLTVQFFDQSTANVKEWFWFFSGGTPEVSTEQNPLVTFEEPGTYYVYLNASNAAGSLQSYKEAFIITDETSLPNVNFTSTLNGQEIRLDNYSNNANSYHWDFGDGNSSLERNPVHTYAEAGVYQVRLLATNACGQDSLIQIVNTNIAPQAAFSTNQEGCAPLTVQFSDLSSGTNISWQWTFPGAVPEISMEQNPTVVYADTGRYDVQLIVENTAGVDTLLEPGYVQVLAAPTANFSAQEADQLVLEFTNLSTNSDRYEWTFGDGNSSNAPNPTHTYASDGDYTIRLIAISDCGRDTFMETITLMTVSTALPSFVERFELFPNPNKGQFNLILEGVSGEPLEMRIYDILGQEVLQRELNADNGTFRLAIDLDWLSKGAYLLRLSDGKAQLFRKIIIQ